MSGSKRFDVFTVPSNFSKCGLTERQATAQLIKFAKDARAKNYNATAEMRAPSGRIMVTFKNERIEQ